MVALVSLPSEEVLEPGRIDDFDVLKLKNSFYNSGTLSAEDADELFALHDSYRGGHPPWADFFVEAISDYVIDQVEPEGYLAAEGSLWVVERISKSGRIARKDNFELLVNVLDKARWTPVSLVRLALEQVRIAVVEGDGPLRAGQSLEKGRLSSPEVEVVRHILCAFGGGAGVALTRPEIDVLFEIDDAIVDWSVNPAWTDLFVKAVTNVAMAASGHAVPPREKALKRDEWVERRGECATQSLLFALVASSLEAIKDIYHDQSPEERALARLEQQRIEIITNEEIASVDVAWLCERIEHSAQLTSGDLPLATHLKSLSARIHPDLRATVDRLGRAA